MRLLSEATWRLLGCTGGAAAGFCLWWGAVGSTAEVHPDWWGLAGRPADLAMPAHAGELQPHPSHLDLYGHEGVSPRFGPMLRGEVRVRARVPHEGQLKVGLGAPSSSSPPPPSRTETYHSRTQVADGPPPSEERSFEPPPPRLLVVDRGRRDAVYGVGLECEAMSAPDREFELHLRLDEQRIRVLLDGEEVGECEGLERPAHVEFGAGLRRIQIREIELRQSEDHFHQVFGRGLRGPAGWLGSALLGALLGGLVGRRRGLAIALLPFSLTPLLVRTDLRALLDRLRVLDLDESLAPLVILGVPALALALADAARASNPRVAGAAALVPALSILAWELLAGWGASSLGLVLLGGLALPWTALVRLNTHPCRHRVLGSYLLFGALLALAELGLRHTALDSTWTRTAGWERAASEFEELLVLRQHRDYPSEGFPVRPPPPGQDRRVVAFGGSSTGGAFQMDDLDLFWPRILQDRLPEGWEVVNQGVGGWNTLHIRLYVESQLQRLEPDVVVLYVGHNDALTYSNQRYSEYLRRYRSPDRAGSDLLRRLDRSRLFVGFRFAVLLAGQRSEALAVPVQDARENLAAIIDASREVGARVLLLSEGVHPEPLALADYVAMQAELAEQAEDVAALDTSALLYDSGDPNHFLDACHLSVTGHRAVADWVAEELRRLDWLSR